MDFNDFNYDSDQYDDSPPSDDEDSFVFDLPIPQTFSDCGLDLAGELQWSKSGRIISRCGKWGCLDCYPGKDMPTE
jgi:hypothetical protein